MNWSAFVISNLSPEFSFFWKEIRNETILVPTVGSDLRSNAFSVVVDDEIATQCDVAIVFEFYSNCLDCGNDTNRRQKAQFF